jgi:16S rRNA methyltransferase gidB
MEYADFEKIFLENSDKMQIEVKNIEKFYKYMQLLLEWNEKINLTTIVEPEQIIVKHFLDSLTIKKYIEDEKNIIDVGTGAGFPGVPLAIETENNVTLLDSLNKRINFLNDVKEKIGLENVVTVHSRAEDAAKDKKYRECFDYAVSRAVAPMNVLLEYLLPFVKVGGKVICMKGPNVKEEMDNSEKVAKILGGKIEKVEELEIPEIDMKRTVVIVKKIEKTSSKYPRKAGTPSKEPLA